MNQIQIRDPGTEHSFALSDLDYGLPAELIAQSPAARREDARLLSINRGARSISDGRITDLPDLLNPGDLLVLNDTKVVPAKFVARRQTGGRVGGLFLHSPSSNVWEVLLESSGRLRPGETIVALQHARLLSAHGEARAPAFMPGSEIQDPPQSPLGKGGGKELPASIEVGRAHSSCSTAHSGVALELVERIGGGRWSVRVDDGGSPEVVLEQIGRTPLPPYIRRDAAGKGGESANSLPRAQADSEQADRERYQTVYAARPGAVAAPTAGLHLTQPLLARIRERGVKVAFVTLHLGLGTFKPMTAERIADHEMHSERFELPATTADAINACRARGGRVVAVGTTTVRVLESAGEPKSYETMKPRSHEEITLVTPIPNRDHQEQIRDCKGAADSGQPSPLDGWGQRRTAARGHEGMSRLNPPIPAGSGETSIFIYPPFEFQVVDALLTNFHLPRSTLLALIMAFAGTDLTKQAYAHAISQLYRFYSFGDAMFIA